MPKGTVRVVTLISGGTCGTDYNEATYHVEQGFLVIAHVDTNPKNLGGKLRTKVPLGNINQILEIPETTQ